MCWPLAAHRVHVHGRVNLRRTMDFTVFAFLTSSSLSWLTCRTVNKVREEKLAKARQSMRKISGLKSAPKQEH